jgi:DNA-binding MurR/RpiR family transcriptional regulator
VSIYFTELTKTDRKITSQLLVRPDILIHQSIQAAAIDLGVSPAAIMRIVKKLKYRGLAEFKLSLEEIEHPEVENNVEPRKRIIKEVIDSYHQVLPIVEKMLDEGQLKRIVGWLSSYSQVKVLGLGSSGLAAEQLVYSLLYQDEYIESVTSRTKMFYLSRALTSDYFLLIYSVSGNLSFYQEMFEKAKKVSAKVVLLTMNRDDNFKDLVDEVILLPSNYTNFSNKNGLRQLDNRFNFYIVSEIITAYYEAKQ